MNQTAIEKQAMVHDFTQLAMAVEDMVKHASMYGKLTHRSPAIQRSIQHGGNIGGISGRSGIGEDFAASRLAKLKADQEAALGDLRGMEQASGRGKARGDSLAEKAGKKSKDKEKVSAK